MTLISDVVSQMKPDVVYGFNGEKVKLISDHGNVLIVEGKNGRFPVHKSKVSNGNSENLQGKESGRCEPDSNNMPSNTGKQAKPMAKTAKPGKGNKNSKAISGPTLFG